MKRIMTKHLGCLSVLLLGFALSPAAFAGAPTAGKAGDLATQPAAKTADAASDWLASRVDTADAAATGGVSSAVGAGKVQAPAQGEDWLAMTDESKRDSDASSRLVVGSPGQPEAAQETEEVLAKKTQNPVADLITVPFQSNFNFYNIHTRLGPMDYDRHTMGYLLNVQPVIPFKLSEEWNIITRTIVPIVNQPQLAPGMGSHGGLGDVQFTPFFSPSRPSKLVCGAGPVLVFPTATDQWLGSGKCSAGPSGVLAYMDGPWVIGVLAQNLWSYAGESDRNYVNQMVVQPFVNYNLPKGWYINTGPMITADWHADSDERWTVPLGAGVGKLFFVGKLPVNASLAGYYNVVHPTFGPEWSARFQLQFLFPK